MNLADERLKELDNPSLTTSERILIRCAVASDLIHKGQYESASEAFGELWLGVGQILPLENQPPTVQAEVLLRCGTLTHWLGKAQNISGAQERAKDMLSEAMRLFHSQGMLSKVAETQYELSPCYWGLGQRDEARIILEEALKPLTDTDIELRGKILIRRSIIELWDNKCHDALSILKEAEPVFESANDALKGRWYGQKGLILRRLAAAEGEPDYYDRAIIEYTAAIYHYEQAKHERYCARNLNNLAFLLYKLGRYNEAHEHLDRAQLIFTTLKDKSSLAQVDETRTRVLIAEKKYRDADRIIASVIKIFEKGQEVELLIEALILQGIIWARLGVHENSIVILRRAIKVAQDSDTLIPAGYAALTLIEEHGNTFRLSEQEVSKTYQLAYQYLKSSQDAEDKDKLLTDGQIVIKRLSGMQIHDKNFTFYGAVHELEERLIERALELEGGSITHAAKRLGLKHQTLSQMLRDRHKKLFNKRTPPTPRMKSIIKEPKK
jgi:tetratricopeptide (TPR) repeat protein